MRWLKNNLYICNRIAEIDPSVTRETRTPFRLHFVRDNLKSGKMKEFKCSICQSKKWVQFNTSYGNYLCAKHNQQLYRYGKILECTIYDRNPIIINGDHAEIIIFDSKHKEKGRALIDIEDVDLVKNYKWCLNGSGYAINKKIGRLHRFILNIKSLSIKPDHINRNKLDCRKFNLRLLPHFLNIHNSKMWSHNTSGTTGIWWNKKRQKWLAGIQINSKTIRLGAFYDIQDAINARKEAERKLLPIEIYPR